MMQRNTILLCWTGVPLTKNGSGDAWPRCLTTLNSWFICAHPLISLLLFSHLMTTFFEIFMTNFDNLSLIDLFLATCCKNFQIKRRRKKQNIPMCPNLEKIGNMGSSLPGNYCDLEGKNKEIYNWNMSCWREILQACREINIFSRPECVQICN